MVCSDVRSVIYSFRANPKAGVHRELLSFFGWMNELVRVSRIRSPTHINSALAYALFLRRHPLRALRRYTTILG